MRAETRFEHTARNNHPAGALAESGSREAGTDAKEPRAEVYFEHWNDGIAKHHPAETSPNTKNSCCASNHPKVFCYNTSMTTANDYDNWAAIRQKELKAGEKLPHKYVEKPAMQKLLPDLSGKKVLLLGCGTGEEAMLLKEYGATDMVGVDLSKESIRLAQESYPDVTFMVGDMHTLDFENETFDFIYSSLTVHYSSDPIQVYTEVFRVLKPGGVFQFSIGHPVRWASERLTIDGASTKLLGFSEDPDKRKLYGTYSSFRQYDETFPSGEVLRFWIGPPSMHFTLLRQARFAVEEFVETRAIEECKEVDEYYFIRNHEFPQFCVFVAKK